MKNLILLHMSAFVLLVLAVSGQSRRVLVHETDFVNRFTTTLYSDGFVKLSYGATDLYAVSAAAEGVPFGVAPFSRGEVIVGLRSPGKVQLERFQVIQGVLQSVELVSFPWAPGYEPTHMTFDRDLSRIITGNLLQIMDQVGVLYASTPMASGAPLLPMSWSPIGAISDYAPVRRERLFGPLLLGPYRLDDSGGQISVLGVALAIGGLRAGLRIEPDNSSSGYSLQYFDDNSSQYADYVVLDLTSAVEGSSALRIDTAPLRSGQVTVEGSVYPFALGSTETQTLVHLTSPLQVGDQIVVISSDNVVWADFPCPIYYDNPSGTDNVVFAQLGIEPLHIGDLNFVYSAAVATTMKGLDLRPLAPLALFGLGTRTVGLPDPVVWTTSGWMLDLNQVLLLPAVGYVGNEGLGDLYVELPIADDPSLVGAVVFFQFALSDGGTVVPSDIIGMEIQPAR